MSGASRVVSRTEASIFLAAAKAAPLSRTPDSAFSDISTAGSEACDIENDMGTTPHADEWFACGRGPCTQSNGVASSPHPMALSRGAVSQHHDDAPDGTIRPCSK